MGQTPAVSPSCTVNPGLHPLGMQMLLVVFNHLGTIGVKVWRVFFWVSSFSWSSSALVWTVVGVAELDFGLFLFPVIIHHEAECC